MALAIAVDMRGIGQRVRQMRQARQMSQGALARALQVSQARISELEEGKALGMRIHLLVGLCRELECSADWVLGLPAIAPPPCDPV